MTTTTRPTLEMDKVVGEPVAEPAVEQQGKAMDEAGPTPVPWTELAPSEYAVLTRWSAFRSPGEEHQAPAMAAAVAAEPFVDKEGLARAAVLVALVALADARVAHLTNEEKEYVFGLFVRRTAWSPRAAPRSPGQSAASSRVCSEGCGERP